MTFVPPTPAVRGDGGVMDDSAERETLDADRVIVGVDGSASSIAALRYAARTAAAFDAPIEAISTWAFPRLASAYAVAHWSPEEDARAVLDSAVEQAFGSEPPPGLVCTVLPGPPARTLVELSRGAGMLVLGSRGLGGFRGLLLGSVSSACAAHAHCPVLIVHGDTLGDAGAPAEEESQPA